MVAEILGYTPQASKHLAAAVTLLAESAARPDWASLEEVDVPLRQRALSNTIDEASFSKLLDLACDVCSRTTGGGSSCILGGLAREPRNFVD